MSKRFKEEGNYRSNNASYDLLPFNFMKFDNSNYIATNLVGDYLFMTQDELTLFVNKQLVSDSTTYRNLKGKLFLYEKPDTYPLNLLALRYRTKKHNRSNLTGLHIFVVSLRCDHSCPYCQVSRQNIKTDKFDMNREIADKGIDFVFESPSPYIKIEFQGGESLLNFELIKYITIQSKEKNQDYNKSLEFVVATNLAFLDDEILDFCKIHNIYISTSLDGPEYLHNKNRPRPGNDSYQLTKKSIDKAIKVLGPDKVSALMTTTEESLSYPKEIINEYISTGFNSIFLRPLSPYGFAVKTKSIDKYQTEEWLRFYTEGLNYILQLNKDGLFFAEAYASIILQKILTPFDDSYVDLQSPAGIGLSAIVFNYNGDVYASDEARMLAEMGDETFNLGNLFENSFEEIMLNPKLITPLEESLTLSSPMCNECPYIEYCGSDPVYHHTTQKDFVGSKPNSSFCTKNMAIFKLLIELMKDEENKEIFYSWIRI